MEKPVVFKNKNGKQLVGIFHLPKTEKKVPLVIFCHGFAGTKTRSKYVKLARVLAKSGIASFRFDFEGCGDSEGDFEKITVKRETSDLSSAVRYAASQRNIDKKRVAFLGSSLGAAVIALCLNKEKFPFKTLVFWAPALNQKKLFSVWHTKNNLKKWKKQGFIVGKEDKIGGGYLKENEKKDYSEFLFKIQGPILIIHGGKDETVPLKFSESLVKSHKNIKLIIIPGADHKFEDYLVQKRLIQETAEWFKEKL